MAKNYKLADEAQADLREITAFITKDNPKAARNTSAKIHEACALLATHPHIGHTREDVARQDVRFWSIGHYCIIYKAETSPLFILRILSGYRDIEALLH